MRAWWEEIHPEIKNDIARRAGCDLIGEALATTDYNELVRLTVMINDLAKIYYQVWNFNSTAGDSFASEEEAHEYNIKVAGVSDGLYQMKDILLAKAGMYARAQAPTDSWGWGLSDDGHPIFYFDLPGYRQFSFHVKGVGQIATMDPKSAKHQRLDDLGKIYFNAQFPRYHGQWEMAHEWMRGLSRDSKEIWEAGPTSASLEEIRHIVEQGEIGPGQMHRLYCRAMAHPQFPETRGEIRKLLFPNAPSVPGALQDAYVHGADVEAPKDVETPVENTYYADRYRRDGFDFEIVDERLAEIGVLLDQNVESLQREGLDSLMGPIRAILMHELSQALGPYYGQRPREILLGLLEKIDDLLTRHGIPEVEFFDNAETLLSKHRLQHEFSKEHAETIDPRVSLKTQPRKRRGRTSIRYIDSGV